MKWTEEKDVMMMKEIAAQGVFQYKFGSRERGNVWNVVAQNLTSHTDLFDGLTERGARDRYTLISRRFKVKISEELKSSGIGGEPQTEYEILLEELVHLSDEAEKRAEIDAKSIKDKANLEKQKALDIRKKAMEKMGETRKRSAEDVEEEEEEFQIKEQKKRRRGSETMLWLEKKAERDAKFRELQLEEQRRDREMQRGERKEQLDLQQKQLQMQLENQQQKQQQQTMLMQQMIIMMQQQQQQMQLMFSKLHDNKKDSF